VTLSGAFFSSLLFFCLAVTPSLPKSTKTGNQSDNAGVNKNGG
jgi:hypothetical protein